MAHTFRIVRENGSAWLAILTAYRPTDPLPEAVITAMQRNPDCILEERGDSGDWRAWAMPMMVKPR